ncbi:MAG: PaaI family thioesterase [bacterium]|nr:PaaI family thioesterase [bacterium]MDE0352659.1 PaaI family thioesterase [bacterium]
MAEPVPPIAPIVDALRRHTGDGCFACGRSNPIGLHIDNFDIRGEEVVATFTARDDLQGTIGNLHGGIAAVALDEILVWAGILQEEVLSVTGRLELRYRRPVGVAGEIELRGRVEERRGNRLVISGSLDPGDGGMSVTAKGLYLVSHTIAEIMEEAGL